MTATFDYANLYERQIRPRRRIARRAVAMVVWLGLLTVRPSVAMAIWRQRGELRIG